MFYTPLRELQARPPRGETSTRRARGRDGRAALRLLGQIEAQLAALVDGAEALRQARPTGPTLDLARTLSWT